MEEIWKQVEEAPRYYVSNLGNVKSVCTDPSGVILKQGTDKDGYKKIQFNVGNGKKLYRRVHRVVAQAFIENPQNLPIINHKDGNVANNEVSNLEWCDNSYNQLYRYRVMHGTWDKTRIGRQYTFTPISVTNIHTNEVLNFDYINDCARHFGISDSAIFNRLRGRVRNPSNSPKSKINDWFFQEKK